MSHPPVEKRRIERKSKGAWVLVPSMLELRVGDEYRMFEPDGKPVDGGGVHRVTEAPVVMGCGCISVVGEIDEDVR